MVLRPLLHIGLFALVVYDGLHAQAVPHAKNRVSVPLVGRKSDGQVGPVEAPESGTISVGISNAAGRHLAYYQAASAVGVLAAQISYISGDGSGSIMVAEMAARVFPSFRSYAMKVMDLFDVPEIERVYRPYPKDVLTYRSERVVEFKTPARTDGLGTRPFLPKNDSPIRGVAVLVGQSPDLLHLSVRLPAAMTRFTSAIIQQAELDGARLARE